MSARAKPTDAGLAALGIIRHCASDGVPPTGGFAYNFGKGKCCVVLQIW